jgi:hypothetical protein
VRHDHHYEDGWLTLVAAPPGGPCSCLSPTAQGKNKAPWRIPLHPVPVTTNLTRVQRPLMSFNNKRDIPFHYLSNWLRNFLGPNVEPLPAYFVHLGDRSTNPGLHCLPTIRELQPAQCSIVSRKFRRAGGGITTSISGGATASRVKE